MGVAHRVVLIVGGGIGAATARRFAVAGAQVVATYHHSSARAQDLVASLSGRGHLALPLDVTDPASLEAAEAVLAEVYGRVDVLVNAGGTTTRIEHADADALTDEKFDQILVANVRGPFAIIRSVRRLMEASGDATWSIPMTSPCRSWASSPTCGSPLERSS